MSELFGVEASRPVAEPRKDLTQLMQYPTGDSDRQWARRRSAYWLAALVPTAIALWLTREYVMDDALITLRYSFNWAHTGAPVWNSMSPDPGNLAYTTTLWMALNAVPALFLDRGELIYASRFLAMACLLTILWLFADQAVRLRIRPTIALIYLVAVFGQVGHGFHANSAMETILFSTLVVAAFAVTVDRDKPTLGYILAGLALLTRPEGVFAILALVAFDAIRGRYRQAIKGVGIGALFAGVQALHLMVHHGVILPNAFFIKQSDRFLNQASVRHTLFFALAVGGGALLLCAWAALKGSVLARLCLLFATLLLAYHLSVEPLMNVHSRYQWPALIVASLGGMSALTGRTTTSFAGRAVAIVATAWLALAAVASAIGLSYYAKATGTAMNNLLRLGAALEPYKAPDAWLAYHDAGAVCFMSDWNCIDTIGLANRAVARREISKDELLARPDVVLLLNNFDSTRPEAAQRRQRQRAGEQGFFPVQSAVLLDEPGHRQFGVTVFARDLETAEHMLRTLQTSPEIPNSPFYPAYRFARRLVKRR